MPGSPTRPRKCWIGPRSPPCLRGRDSAGSFGRASNPGLTSCQRLKTHRRGASARWRLPARVAAAAGASAFHVLTAGAPRAPCVSGGSPAGAFTTVVPGHVCECLLINTQVVLAPWLDY